MKCLDNSYFAILKRAFFVFFLLYAGGFASLLFAQSAPLGDSLARPERTSVPPVDPPSLTSQSLEISPVLEARLNGQPPANERKTDADLPDAPAPSPEAVPSYFGPAPFDHGPRFAPPPVAPIYHKYIEPGQTAQPLSTSKKVLFGFHQLESPYLLLTVVAAAGYEQALNDSPNYGTNIKAYGQRVGAAAARNASQTIFTDSIMAPIFHEDPRYYVMGKRRNGFVRAGYAVGRVLVTRSDDGTNVPNYSLFSGYAEAAALEQAYYPSINRGFTETAKAFGGSLGGAALSNVVREFLPDILHAAHLE